MKINFLNALYLRLIDSKGYYPARDQNGNIQQTEDFKVVQKRGMGADLVIDIINGDSVSAEKIAAVLQSRQDIFAVQPPSTSISFLNIFVFDSAPDPLKLEAIISNQYNIQDKKYVACFTVNLSENQVTRHFEVPYATDGLEKTINDIFNMDFSGYNQMDIDSLMEQKTKEYAIDLKVKVPFLTYGFIVANIVVWALLYFLVQVKGANYNNLLFSFGAKDNYRILSGEYWRLISPIFLHADITHLALNCYSLYAVGVTVERIYGHAKFFFIYLLAGIIGNIASFMLSTNWAVGASGAIFGMLGAILYFGLERPAAFKRHFGKSIIITLVINIGYGLSNARIDNFAHFGGLIGGFLSAGIVKAHNIKVKFFNRAIAFLLTLAVVVGGLYYGFNNVPHKKETASILLQQNRWAEAEELAEELMKENRLSDGEALQLLKNAVEAEFYQKKYDEAIEHAKIIAEDELGYGNYLLGLCYYNLKKYDDAYKALQIAKEHEIDLEQVDKVLRQIEAIRKP